MSLMIDDTKQNKGTDDDMKSDTDDDRGMDNEEKEGKM